MKNIITAILPDSLLPDEDQQNHSQKLLQVILNRIEEEGGWIDFATFMNMALYQPSLGYYVAGQAKLGWQGDFVTAPELGDFFARTLAHALSSRWTEEHLEQPTILELGAGSGALAFDLLQALEKLGKLPCRYCILEVSPELKTRQLERLSTLPSFLFDRIQWLDSWPTSLEGMVLANEVLDAFAVHRVEFRSHSGWWEWGVSVEKETLVWHARPLSNSALIPHLPALSHGVDVYTTEINVAALGLMANLADTLVKGAAYFIDYGFPAREFFHPQRRQGTLMCHYRHHAHTDPLQWIGLQDITAHVNFTAVAETAINHGLAVKEYATQAQFLIRHGLMNHLLTADEINPALRARQNQQINFLMSPAEMGELFKVLVLGVGESDDAALVQLGLEET